MAYTDFNTEDRVVQATFAEHLEKVGVDVATIRIEEPDDLIIPGGFLKSL